MSLSDFDSRLNVIVGPNAYGKTSILEALSLATLLKSFRTSSSRELIQSGQSQGLIHIQLERPTASKISIGLEENRKSVFVDEKKVASRVKYPYLASSLSFSPDDLLLIKASPERRRDFLDSFSLSLDPTYAQVLQRFEKILRQRNSLLKQIREGSASFEALPLWTESLVAASVPIYRERLRAVQILNEKLPQTYQQLFGISEKVRLLYGHRFEAENWNEDIEKSLYNKLNIYAEAEKASGHTLVGPHKDDLEFFIDGMDVRTYGSQGQTRGLVIALKVTQLLLTKESRSFSPILLLDDIISELDDHRVQALVHFLSNYPGQLFVTTAEVNKVASLHREFSGFRVIDLGAQSPTIKPSRAPEISV